MALQQVTTSDFEREVLQSDRGVLVDFYAVWCPPCRSLAPLLERFAEQNAAQLKVVKLDTDEDEELAQQYGVMKIPTLVYFKNGQEVRRAINPQSRAALEALVADQ